MIINEKLIDLDLNTRSRIETINKLCEVAFFAGKLKNKNEFMEKVISREQEISTDLGQGIAIPHGKSDSVIEPFIIFAKLQEPIIWNEQEHTKIDLIFMIGVPEHNGSTTHLKIISQIAANFIDEEFVNQLRQSKDKRTVLNCFEKIKI